MEIVLALSIILLTTAIVFLDYTRRINVICKPFLAIYLLIYPNIIFIMVVLKKSFGTAISSDAYTMLLIFIIAGYIYMFGRINIFPTEETLDSSSRWNVMLGGRIINYCGLYTFVTQWFVYLYFYNRCIELDISQNVITIATMYSFISVVLLIVNGTLRIFFTSNRLGVKNRVIMLCTMIIPVVNIIVLLNISNLVYEEYDYECNKRELEKLTVHSYSCETKYPIVLVHGISLKDLRYFNYWGRIPAGLIMNGATIYYGHQESLGTVLTNANEIKDTVIDIIKTTGCEKVNIIAHSKGGLDARYAISLYGIDRYVASLTTISTPHKGSKFADVATKIPNGIYKMFARYYNKKFKRLGNSNPDFYAATMQYTTSTSRKFNDGVKDSRLVFYQSYAAKMKNFMSNFTYFIPYLICRRYDKDNDGIVNINSAKWGEFKGTFQNEFTPGISHGDEVDIKRKDCKGFDIVEEYINIVSELKKKGY